MKIVNREEFLAMPEGALFSKYHPCAFGDFAIKGKSLKNDFWFQQISDAVDAGDSNEFGDILLDAEKTGVSFRMDFDCETRDGDYDADQLFAVWERGDVEQLIERLQLSLTAAYQDKL